MRDQYAGDISDVLKFAFLRALASNDRCLGIAWYYDRGDDGRPDGQHLEWRDQLCWQQLDSELHAGLSTLPERSIAALERALIWPSSILFHREPMPTRMFRKTWAEGMSETLQAADVVFLDPDNGLGKETNKHATMTELRLLRRPNRAIVFITFPGRSKTHKVLVQELHERLVLETGATKIITLRTSISIAGKKGGFVPRTRWFTVVDPDPILIARIQAFAELLANMPRVRVQLKGLEDCN